MIRPQPAIDRFDRPDDKTFRIDPVDARRDDEIALFHIGRAWHVVHAQRVALPDDDPLCPGALDHRSRGGVAIDEHLDLGGAGRRQDHPADHAGRRNHRHVRLEAIGRPLVDRHVAEFGVGAGGDDFGGDGLEP